VDGLATETIQEEGTDNRAVANIQPFGAGNEAANVAGFAELGCREKEVRVKTGEAGESTAKLLGDSGSPTLGGSVEVVVPDVRGIREVCRSAVPRWQLNSQVVSLQHSRITCPEDA